jgi:hypothetical protein
MRQMEEIINIKTGLRLRGFDHTFMLEHEHIRCLEYNELVLPCDFEIAEIHYCKTPEDMKHSSIIYGIELERYGIKGILMSHYRCYLSGMSLQLWSKFGAILQKMNSQSISGPQFNHLIIVRTNN